jgi:hypothetical protein
MDESFCILDIVQEAELAKLGLMTRAAEKFEDETLEQRPAGK